MEMPFPSPPHSLSGPLSPPHSLPGPLSPAHWRCVSTSCVWRDQDIRTVATPPFAESVSEGDVRWEKGKTLY